MVAPRTVPNSRGVMPADLRAVRLRVGRNVHRLRRSHAVSQERLAELAGNSGKHIGQIERGEVNVTIDILTSLAAALAVDVAELFVSLPRRRRADAPLYLVTGRQLAALEDTTRGIRAARLKDGE